MQCQAANSNMVRWSVEFTIQHGVEMAWCNSVELALIYLAFQQGTQTENELLNSR
jgi:hypothetical protein